MILSDETFPSSGAADKEQVVEQSPSVVEPGVEGVSNHLVGSGPVWVVGSHLEDDEEGEEEQHKQQQAAGVHGQQVVLVGEVRLGEGPRRGNISH